MVVVNEEPVLKELNKELLSWYLITLKLKETVEAGLSKSQPNSPTPKGPKPPLLLTQGEPPPPPAPRLDSEWVISIRDKLDAAQQEEALCPWAKLSIYRVPKSLRNDDDRAYVPQVVSLGPYHHGKRRLRDMDRHKWRALQRVIDRTGHCIELYLNSVKLIEDEARACYEGKISLTSNAFVEMMVLDGTFILELFRGAAGGGFKKLGYEHNDPVFAMRSTMHSVRRDMIMLENQVPLFVLDQLLALQISKPDPSGLVATLALQFFDPLMPTDEPLRKTDRSKIESCTCSGPFDPLSRLLHCLDVSRQSLLRPLMPTDEPLRKTDRSSKMQSSTRSAPFDPLSKSGLHCLDVFRQSLLLTGPQPTPRVWIKRPSHNRRAVDKRGQQLIHCVSELREAGIKFRKIKTDRFWDIKFKNGVLEIPRLLIHDGTKSLFLNL